MPANHTIMSTIRMKAEVTAAAAALRNNWNYDAFEFVYWNAHYIGLMFMTYVNENKWYNFELNYTHI